MSYQQYFSSFSSAIKEAKNRKAVMDEMIRSMETKLQPVYDAIDDIIIRNATIKAGISSGIQGDYIGVSECRSGLERGNKSLKQAASDLYGLRTGINVVEHSSIGHNISIVNSVINGNTTGTATSSSKTGIHMDWSVESDVSRLKYLAHQISAVSEDIKKVAEESGNMGNTDDVIVFQGKALKTAEDVLWISLQLDSYVRTLSGIFEQYQTLQDNARSRAAQI